jgi:EmrB/QacA subfamily drug resistance transporter
MPNATELTKGQRNILLAMMALALMTVISAVSGLNVALPSLAEQTGATSTELQWIVDSYTVVFAGLLLIAGAVGDRFGRKEILQFGLGVFGVAAALAFFTTDPALLIFWRALMGLGAASIMPTTLSVITTSFPPEERGRAVGVWVGVAGGGAVIGLFASGILLEFFAWNSFFALNVVLAIVAFIGCTIVVPRSRDPHAIPLDWVGAFLSLISVGGLVYGIIEGPNQGWDQPQTLVPLIAGAVATVLFFIWEAGREHPMLDPRLFRLKGFSAGSISITIQFFAAFGFFFTVLQYLQFVAGLSPLLAATCMLPMPFILIPLSRQTPKLAARIGFAFVGSIGLVLMAIGFLVFSRLSTDFSYWYFLAGLVPFAAGMAFAGPPATTAIIASLPRNKQGVASAVNDTSREIGSAFGIAILGSLLTEGYKNGMKDAVVGLPQQIADIVTSSVAFVQSDKLASFGPKGAELAATAKTAFVSGVSQAFTVAALALVVGAVVVFIRAPRGATVVAEDILDKS